MSKDDMDAERDHGAAARLLDVALGELTGGRTAPDVTAAVLQRLAAPPRAKLSMLQAAMVLLGLGVVVAVWLLRERSGDAGLQQPAPEPLQLPMASVSCAGVSELRQLPDDLHDVELTVDLHDASELVELRRFAQLTQLCVTLPSARNGVRVEISSTALAPLAELPQLQQLNLMMGSLTAASLAPLAKAPRLSTLATYGTPLDPDLAKVLASMPHLRELRLCASKVTVPGVRDLAMARGLETLMLQGCSGFDAAAQAELGALPSLRVLVIEGAGMPVGVLGSEYPQLSPVLWQAIAAARQSEVRLRNCRVDDALLAALPSNLHGLSLVECPGVTPTALRQLKRCGDLRSLGLGSRAADQRADIALHAAEADLVGALRLQHFNYQGELTAPMLRAIAAQASLRELELQKPDGGAADLSFVSGLASLERVVLWGSWPAQVRPLASCKRLRRVELRNCGDPRIGAMVPQILRAALGPRVEVLLW